jgi:hypothetical protein
MVLEIDELTSTDLLRKALIALALLDSEDLALKLVKRLTFLPLAIVLAAAYINANDASRSTCRSFAKQTNLSLSS